MAVVTSAEFEVRVFDVAPERAKAADERGLATVSGLEELAEWAECVVTVLPTPEALFEVIGTPGDGGPSLTGRRSGGLLIIDVGSGAPIRTRDLAEQLAQTGHWLVDAPVSGSPGMAEQAKLIAMIGGTENAVELASPVLSASCSTLLLQGGPGSGHATKLVNNLLAAAHLASTVEALLMARAAGFDPATLVPGINRLTGASYASEVKMERYVLSGAYDSGFPIRSLITDLDNGAAWFGLLDQRPTFAETTYATWSQAAAELGGDADHTLIAKWLEARTGVALSSEGDGGRPVSDNTP
jgi:3-hydroxyisobutyrate dehydrogenase